LGRSILITRAPRSASWRVANGAATACSNATTVMSSRGRIPDGLFNKNYRTKSSRYHNAKVLPISALQPIACPENPPYYRQADQEKSQSHRQAHTHAHVRLAVEAPAKAADQIDHRIE